MPNSFYRTTECDVWKTERKGYTAHATFSARTEAEEPCASADKMVFLESVSNAFKEIYCWAVEHLAPQEVKTMAKRPDSITATEFSRTISSYEGCGVVSARVQISCTNPTRKGWGDDEKADFLHRVQEGMTETYQWMVENIEAAEREINNNGAE